MRGQIYFLSALFLVVPNKILAHGEKQHISKQIHISKHINIGLPNQDPSIENEDISNNVHQIHRDLTIVTNHDKKKKSTHGNNHRKKIINLQPHKTSHSTHVHIQSSQFGSQESDKNIDSGELRNDRKRKKALKEENLKAISDGIKKKKALKTKKLLAHKKGKKNLHNGEHTGDITIDILKQNRKFDTHGGDFSSDSRSDDLSSASRSEDFSSDSRSEDFSSDSRSEDSSSNLHSHHVKQVPQLNSKKIDILRDNSSKNKNIGIDLLSKLKSDREKKKALKADKLKAVLDDIEKKKAIKADKLKALKIANSQVGLHTGGITIDITKQNSKSDSSNEDISESSESHGEDLIPQLSSKELEILRDHIEIIHKNSNAGGDWLSKLKDERERKKALKAEKLKAVLDDIERKKAIKAEKLKALKETKTDHSHTGLHTGSITIDITKQNSKSDGDSSGGLHSHHVQVIPQLIPEGVEILRDYNIKHKNTDTDLLDKLNNDRDRKEALKAEKLKVILDDIERKKAIKANKLKTLKDTKAYSQAGLHSKQSDAHAGLHSGGLIIDINKQSEYPTDSLDKNREQDEKLKKVGGSVKKAVNSVSHVVTGSIGTIIDATIDQLKKSRDRNHNKSSQKLLSVEVSKTQSDLLNDRIPVISIPAKTIQISHSFSHDKNLGISDENSQTDVLKHHLIPTNKKKIAISHSLTHKNLDTGSSNQEISIIKHSLLPTNKKKIDISHSFTHDKNFDIDSSNQQIGILKHHLPNASTKKKTIDISHSFNHDKDLDIDSSNQQFGIPKHHLPKINIKKKTVDISHSSTHNKNFNIADSKLHSDILEGHLHKNNSKKKTLEISHSFSHDKNLGIGGSKTKTISRKFHLESHKEVI